MGTRLIYITIPIVLLCCGIWWVRDADETQCDKFQIEINRLLGEHDLYYKRVMELENENSMLKGNLDVMFRREEVTNQRYKPYLPIYHNIDYVTLRARPL